MQKAHPNSLQIFNKKRTRTRDRHFSKTYTQGRETRFLTGYLVAKPLIFLRNPVFWRGIGSLACRMPNPLFPSDFYPSYPLHAGVTSARKLNPSGFCLQIITANCPLARKVPRNRDFDTLAFSAALIEDRKS